MTKTPVATAIKGWFRAWLEIPPPEDIGQYLTAFSTGLALGVAHPYLLEQLQTEMPALAGSTVVTDSLMKAIDEG